LINQKTSTKKFNIIVKTDVQGSLTSVVDSLKTLDTEDVIVHLVGTGIGSINENDIRMAFASKAIIYGFEVGMPLNIKQLAARDKVLVRLFRIIYELLDDAKQEMSNLLVPEEVIINVGRLLIRGVFKTTKTEVICGGEVTKGKVVIPALATIYRENKIIAKDLAVTNLKNGPTDTKEVLEGEMCGISLSTLNRLNLQIGDRVEVFTRELRERTL
jgi:translation initiation factor IF-2